MSAHRFLLGIEFAEAKIRLARSGTKPLSLSASHAITVPKNAIVKGVIQESATLIHLLSDAATSLVKSGNECVILIPSDIVYNFVFTYSTKSRRPSLASLITDKLGEPSHAFTVVSHTLSTTATETHIGVSAVRKEWLQAYLTVCARAGLSVRGVSTAPAIALALQKEKTSSPFALLYVPSVDEKSSISLVRHGWIFEDTVISAKRGFAKIFQTTATMIEAKGERPAIKHILIHASSDASTSAKKTFGAAKRKAGRVAVNKAFAIAEEDRVYAGALGASSSAPASMHFNLLQKHTGSRKHLITLGLIVFAIVFVALTFVQ
ncbi:MAG: hypothetical protein KBD00_00235 [Candidatus Peribacteraceae bacterium]|nr:hypothetical protein [Candidatus Peribacteraceae bacterium]